MRVPSLALVVLAGCYYAGGFSGFPGKRVSLGCVDVAVTLTDDRAATEPVVLYSFGNDCLHSTVVDLASVHVVGRYADGHTAQMTAYDPKSELAALPLDAWWVGREEIMYSPPSGDARPDAVCVDVGHIERSAPTQSDRWICLGAWDGGAQ